MEKDRIWKVWQISYANSGHVTQILGSWDWIFFSEKKAQIWQEQNDEYPSSHIADINATWVGDDEWRKLIVRIKGIAEHCGIDKKIHILPPR